MSKRKSISLFAGLVVLLIVVFAHSSVLAQSTTCQAGNYTVTAIDPFPLTLSGPDANGNTCPTGVDDIGYPCSLYRYAISGEDISKVSHAMSLVPLCALRDITVSGQVYDACQGDPNSDFGDNVCGAKVADVNSQTASPNHKTVTFVTSPAQSGISPGIAIVYGGRGGGTFGCYSSKGMIGIACQESNVTVATQTILDADGNEVCIAGQSVVDCDTGVALQWVDISTITIGDGSATFVESLGGDGWVVLSNDAPNTTYYCYRSGRCYPIY
jgi:hypothetical protein